MTIDYSAIRATSRNMERQGMIVAGRYVYRTKTAPDPAYRITDSGSLEALNNQEEH